MKKLLVLLLVFLLVVIGYVTLTRVKLVSEVQEYELQIIDWRQFNAFLGEINYWGGGVREQISRPKIVWPLRLEIVLSGKVENDYKLFSNVNKPPFQAFGFRYQNRILTNQARIYYSPETLVELTDRNNIPYIWRRTTFGVLKMICFQSRYNDRFDDDTRCNQVAGKYSRESQFIRLVRKSKVGWKLVRPAMAAGTCWGTYECGSYVYSCTPGGGTCDNVSAPCGLGDLGTCTRDCVAGAGSGAISCGFTNREDCQMSHCSSASCPIRDCSWTCTPDCVGVADGGSDGCGGTCGGVAPIATNTPVPPGCTSDSQCPSGECCRYNACTVDCGPPACAPARNTDCFLDSQCGDAPGQHEWCPSGKGLDGQNCSESSDGDNYCERNGTQYCCGKLPTFAPCNPVDYPSRSTIVINPNIRTNRSNSDRFDVRVADIPSKFGYSPNPEAARDADPSGCCNLETQIKIGPSTSSLYTPRGYAESCTVSGVMCTGEDGEPAQSAPWGADWKYSGGKVCAQAYVKGTEVGNIVTNCFDPGRASGVMNTPKVLPGGSVSFTVTVAGADGVPAKVRLHDTTRGGESNASYYDDNNIVWREDGGTIQQNADVLLHGCTVTKSGSYTWNFTCLAGTSNMWNGTSSLGTHKVVFSNQYNVETELSYELVEGPPSCNSWSSVKINNCDSAMYNSSPRNASCLTASTTVPVNLSWDLGATHVRFAEVGGAENCSAVDGFPVIVDGDSEDSRWSAWETVAATKNKVLSSGYGEKKLCAQYKNTYGNSLPCGAMTEYYVALPVCDSWGNIKINNCSWAMWNSSPRNTACFTTSTTVPVNLSWSAGVTSYRFIEIASGDCASVSDSQTGWTTWNPVTATVNRTLSLGGYGEKKLCVEYKNSNEDKAKCGAMTQYYAKPRCVDWNDANFNGCNYSQWSASPRNSACYLSSPAASINLAYDTGVNQVRFLQPGSSESCAGISADDSRWQEDWEPVVAVKSKSVSATYGDKKMCVQYRNTNLPVDSDICGGMATYCAPPSTPVFGSISGVSTNGTTSCGGSSATCVSAGTPTWNWTGVDVAGACAIRETYVTNSDIADPVIKAGKVDSYTVPMSLAQNACVSVTARYKNGSTTGSGFTPVWVKSDSLGPMTPSLALSCSYYGLVGGVRRFNVTGSWGVVSDNGCAGVKNYQIDTANTVDFSGTSLQQSVTTATSQSYTNLMSEGTVYGRVKATDNFSKDSSWSATANKVISCDNCGGCSCVCNAPYCGQENGCGDFCANTDAGIPPTPTTVSSGTTSGDPETIVNPATTITFRWNANTDALTDGYYFAVYREGVMVTEMTLAGIATNQYVVNSSIFSDNVVYYWQVAAQNKTCSVETAWSLPRYFVITHPVAPVANAPELVSFTIKNSDATVATTGDGRNHICELVFQDSDIPRRVIFEAGVSDSNGLADIASVVLGWNGKNYNMTLAGAVARAEVDFAGSDNGTGTYPLSVTITDKSGLTNSNTDTNRDFKVWNCEVNVSGSLYDGSDAPFGTPNCANGNGFNTLSTIDYSLRYGNKTMTVSAPNYSDSAGEKLNWARTYEVFIYSGVNRLSPQMCVNGDFRLVLTPGFLDAYAVSQNLDVDFSVVLTQDAWYQVVGGGIRASSAINNRIPMTCASASACKPAMTVESATGANDNGLVTAIDINKGLAGDNAFFGSPNNWSWKGPSGNLMGSSIYNHAYFSQSLVGKLNSIKVVGAGTSLSSVIAGIGGTGIVLVDGNMTIDVNNTVNQDKFLMVVSSGDLTFLSEVTNSEGVFVADKNINIGGDLDSGLTISGIVHSSGGTSQIKIDRSFSDSGDNNEAPAVTIKYRPDFVFSMPSIIGRIVSGWNYN
ncbi:MAG: hypothetical protein WCV93_03410 [Candidatus Shapirobacteria bacterium]